MQYLVNSSKHLRIARLLHAEWGKQKPQSLIDSLQGPVTTEWQGLPNGRAKHLEGVQLNVLEATHQLLWQINSLIVELRKDWYFHLLVYLFSSSQLTIMF